MDKYEYQTYNKSVSIPLIVLIIPILLILVIIFSSFKVYAFFSDNNNLKSERIIEEKKEEDINNIIETEISVPVNIEKEQEESIQITENDNISNENEEKDSKIYTYKANDGKEYDVIATLDIPSLNINYPILSSTSTELLKVSLNKYWGANPNEIGNMVVVGHNYKNGKFFSNLINIKNDAVIHISDLSGRTLDYKVYDTQVIDPYDNSCTSQLTDGHTEITLITCYYEKGSTHATKRFVVKARAN